MDMTFENWDQLSAEAELTKMRKNLRKRNRKLVLTSVFLVIAILFSTVQFGVPAVEKQYWDPRTCTYLENVPDLELTMSVYAELFCQGQILMQPEIRKTGFASYSIDACFLEWESQTALTDVSFRNAAVDKGIWTEDVNFWNELQRGIVYRYPDQQRTDYIAKNQKKTKKLLEELPDYVQIWAAITFAEDLTMEQFDIFTGRYPLPDANFIWAVLRSGDTGRGCGIRLTEYESDRYQPSFWDNTAYPKLFQDRYNWSSEDMQQHVLSMLRFADRQVQQGTGIIPEWADEHIYSTYLSYMEENGVKTYGCYVITTPKVLLNMLQEENVACIRLEKAWIGV